jgi:hypothetical protein
MKKLTKSALKNMVLGSIFAFAAIVAPVALVPAVGAACDPNAGIQGGIDCSDTNNTPDTLFGQDSIFTTVVNVLLFLIGAISVIMLIIGGIRYTVSGGDSGNVTAAKNTIMYALIGLVVAFLAFAIVNWVLGAITPS